MKKILLIIAVLIIGVFLFINNRSDETSTPVDEVVLNYSIAGELADVSDGEGVGFAQAGITEGQYNLDAIVGNVPELEEGYFYEGWIVRKGDNFNFISTGALTYEGDGVYTNVYTSNEDVLDHTFYILTLEPDDGDPAPAEHILEGEMRTLDLSN